MPVGVQAYASQGLTGQTQENMERKVKKMTSVGMLFLCPFLGFKSAPVEIRRCDLHPHKSFVVLCFFEHCLFVSLFFNLYLLFLVFW